MPPATLSVPRDEGVAAGAKVSSGGRTLLPGSRLGAYELLVPLASGGMGHVWSAFRIGDFGFRRAVAIKVMREELAADPDFRRMFLDEARLASRVTHGNVVEVLDLGEDEGVLYQAMALVEGDALSRLAAAAASIPAGVAARIVTDVLRGLHSAHELRGDDGGLLGFVHRDVSPQNILVGVDGIAKLTDFGVAKAAGVAQVASRSGLKGKRSYMPAEQRTGGTVDRRSDVFATGVVLWELLARRKRSSADELPHPCDFDPSISRSLADVAMRAISARPEDRFDTAEAMADAIERVAHASGLALSSRSVAAWVSDLAGGEIQKRKTDTEAQLARTLATTTATVEEVARGSAQGSARRRRLVGTSLAVLAAGTLAATAPRLLRPNATPVEAVAVRSAEALPSADTPAPAAPPVSADVPVASPPSAEASPSATPSAPRARPSRRPHNTPPDLPKFKNPY